ncbi:MAG: sulfatase [Planctomycetes bacterium]|nr:sulfatase [Planctomycetota bacterium]
MDPREDFLQAVTRRHLFQRGGLGLGGAALAALSRSGGDPAATDQGLPGVPHFAPKAKRAIWLFMAGAPSQLDTFDYKPKLHDLFDTDLPGSVRRGQRLTTMTSRQKRFPIAPSKYRFTRTDNGGDGAWVSELLPYTASMTKDLAIVKSVYTDAINHDPAITYITTGRELPGRPSLGSWLSYGLGSENRDLPGFVVMTPRWSGRRDAQALYNRLWGAGMLPSRHAGVALRPQGDPVLFLQNPAGVDAASRRRMLDALARINGRLHERVGDPEIQTRIAQYELAYRMQSSVPELNDLGSEPDSTFAMYGDQARQPGTFAASCLLARRMVERGVRFVQIFHRGWDQHGNLTGDLPRQCRDVDQASWALVQDLKQRGMLEDTLVVWGGEFGRTVYCQGRLTRENYGRDHHPRCFSMWMAGGGIRGGQVYGETDDFSYNVVDRPVHVRDLNATILHCLGIDHERLTVSHQGLDVRLTGVEPARAVPALLA